MGWWIRLAALFVGLGSLGLGAWVIGLLCFGYLAYSFRPKGRGKEKKSSTRLKVSARVVLAGLLLLVSLVAVASGGTFSPLVFAIPGIFLLVWPLLGTASPFTEVIPVTNSVLLRSRFFPIFWSSVSEIKNGPEPFPRSLSSFSGTLLVYTEDGRAYSIAKCFAFSRREAESKLLSDFRSSFPRNSAAAYLLPLDSSASSELFKTRTKRVGFSSDDLVASAADVSGVLVLGCQRGTVVTARALEVGAPGRTSRLPGGSGEPESRPLLWEVLESVGRRTKWPEPDSMSNVLDSMVATRGVPMAERVRGIQGEDDEVTLQSLNGEEVHMSRPQLRAVFSIYS